ncbi:MAG TPA: ATP-dependent sacrificial sulfur transferase LarE [Actinomycetota bacterium]
MAATVSSVKLERLHAVVASTGGAVVAFSGGTDSALVAAVAARALGSRALAVTAVSPSLPPGELHEARRVAQAVGIRHRSVRTHEVEREAYLANGPDRCYHCKTELYGVLERVAADEALPTVLSGANVDDLGDWRPGLRAAAEHAVRHPLVEAGLTKSEVREAALELGVPSWDKPASACLSSRIEHGVRITVEDLTRVGRAERALKELGFRQVRVRVHGDVARVEVEAAELGRLASPGVRERAVRVLRDLGFRYVTMDLEGFRSGSMNPPEAGNPVG